MSAVPVWFEVDVGGLSEGERVAYDRSRQPPAPRQELGLELAGKVREGRRTDRAHPGQAGGHRPVAREGRALALFVAADEEGIQAAAVPRAPGYASREVLVAPDRDQELRAVKHVGDAESRVAQANKAQPQMSVDSPRCPQNPGRCNWGCEGKGRSQKFSDAFQSPAFPRSTRG